MQRDTPIAKPKVSDHYYFQKIFEAFLSASTPLSGTQPAKILHILFKRYERDAAKTYLGFIPGAIHSHTAKIVACSAILENNTTYRGMADALKELCTIEKINPIGALPQLLGAFFSVYPQYLSNISNEKLLAAIQQHQSTTLWEEPSREALRRFIHAHRHNPDHMNHEQLEQLSAAIDTRDADDYADYLLSELRKKRPEARLGLYNGWVAVALGELSSKLSPGKRKQVTDKLLDYLDSDKAGLATIGLCDALVKQGQDQPMLPQVALHLHRYTLRAMPEILELFADHQRSTIARYVPKLFLALATLQSAMTPAMKTDITNLLITPTHIYPLRHGIDALRDWLSPAQKKELRKTMIGHQEFLNLAVVLTTHIYDETCRAKDIELNQHYNECINAAKNAILKDTLHVAYLLPRMQLLQTDSHLTETTKADILAALTKKLKHCAHESTTTEAYIALHQALALGQSWCNLAGKISIATHLMTSLTAHNQIDDISLAIASSAAALADCLKPADMSRVRDTLLALLETKYHQEASLALRTFANHVSPENLPDLMTRLLVSRQPQAALLLAELNEIYSLKDQELKIISRPVI